MIEAARTWSLFRDLRRAARASAEAQRDRQGRRLVQAVEHAYRHVSFYPRVWAAAGVHPGDVRGIDDLAKLPVIDAEQVRLAARSGELVADTARAGLPRLPTTGSSGEPLWVPRGKPETRRWRAAGLYMMFEHGVTWRDLTLHFEARPGPPHPLQRFGVLRSAWIAPTLPTEEQVVAYAAMRPGVVFGTPTILRRVSRALAGATAYPRPRLVFCQGEILDLHSRRILREVLGADPISVYGTTETGYIAWQCEARAALHVDTDLIAVELLRDGVPAAPGEIGRVVVTDLVGRTMPLLRWDTGDLARAPETRCTCGRSLQEIGAIEGRARQCLAVAGRVLSPRAVLDHMGDAIGVDDYELRQDAAASFTLSLAPSANAEAALARLRSLLGGVEIRLACLAPRQAGEKTHPVQRAG